jgi:predicted metal-dependent phosphoesterase TrpH
LRCDLHVHSLHSGPADLRVLRHLGKECYSEPDAVYDQARRRGMDLVTLTDHDSIEGALRLAHLPDTFVSEETTLHLEGNRQLHLGVFDITERQHLAVQARRRDPEALFAYLHEERIAACVNHLFSALTGERALGDLTLPLGRLPLVEALNGSQPSGHNAGARRVGRRVGMSGVGGSDSHTLAGVARAWTLVPGARTKREFLDGLRQGATIVGGRSGSYTRLTDEIVRLFAAGYRDAMRTLFSDPVRSAVLVGLLPLLPLIPVVTAFVYAHELSFGARLLRQLHAASGSPGGTSGRLRPVVRSLGEAA